MMFTPSHDPSGLPARLRLTLGSAALALCGLSGCAPTVNIATPKPVTIDVNIKADVTTRSVDTEKKNDEQDNSSAGPAESYGGGAEPQERPSGGGE